MNLYQQNRINTIFILVDNPDTLLILYYYDIDYIILHVMLFFSGHAMHLTLNNTTQHTQNIRAPITNLNQGQSNNRWMVRSTVCYNLKKRWV